ncbi:TolC family protein [Limnohabitans sp.]|uniref:TolC family protein n=1 Tax=Limnohabitans sp. TaxID=1907725 RepID=UPI0037BECC4C
MASPVWASEVTLAQLLEVALVKHPSVLQARSQAQASGFELEATRWSRYPTLSSELRTDQGTNLSVAKLEQPVWTAGKISSRIGLSEANLRVADAGVLEAETTAMNQVATAFYEVLRLQDRFNSAQAKTLEHERLLSLIERRAKAEITPQADVTLAQARLHQAISERIQIKRQLDASLSTLANWTGPLPGPLRIPQSIRLQASSSVEQAQDKAFAFSAQRKRLLAQLDSAQAQIKVSQSQIYPSLIAGYQHSWGGQVPAATDRGQAYLSMQFQSGAGLSALSGVQAAVARQAAAQQELETLERQLSAQISTAITELQALQAQIEPANALQLGTTDIVESYLRQYQVGRKNWLDVLNAQREKTQALFSLADTRFGLQLAQLNLLILTGDIAAQALNALHD